MIKYTNACVPPLKGGEIMKDILNKLIYPTLVAIVSAVFKKFLDGWLARHHDKRKDD